MFPFFRTFLTQPDSLSAVRICVGSVGAVSEGQVLKVPLCGLQSLEGVGQSGTGQRGEPSAQERALKL